MSSKFHEKDHPSLSETSYLTADLKRLSCNKIKLSSDIDVVLQEARKTLILLRELILLKNLPHGESSQTIAFIGAYILLVDSCHDVDKSSKSVRAQCLLPLRYSILNAWE